MNTIIQLFKRNCRLKCLCGPAFNNFDDKFLNELISHAQSLERVSWRFTHQNCTNTIKFIQRMKNLQYFNILITEKRNTCRLFTYEHNCITGDKRLNFSGSCPFNNIELKNSLMR